MKSQMFTLIKKVTCIKQLPAFKCHFYSPWLLKPGLTVVARSQVKSALFFSCTSNSLCWVVGIFVTDLFYVKNVHALGHNIWGNRNWQGKVVQNKCAFNINWRLHVQIGGSRAVGRINKNGHVKAHIVQISLIYMLSITTKHTKKCKHCQK